MSLKTLKCACRHPDAAQCHSIRYGIFAEDEDDSCECCCHDINEDGVSEWDDDDETEAFDDAAR